jgi:uncharacterized protein (TIRG00374 family)
MTSAESDAQLPRRRWPVGRVLFLIITGVCLYLFLPSIAEVFRAWDRLGEFHPAWIVAIVACEVLSFACAWFLQGLALHSDDAFVIITTHLAGNSFNRITPGGGATGTALQARMLADAGFDLSFAGSALTIWSVVSTAAVLVLPVFAIPDILSGTEVPDALIAAMVVGAGVFVVLVVFAALFLGTRRPVELFARVVERTVRLVRPHAPLPADLSSRLLAERDKVRDTLGARWPEALAAAIGKWAFEYLSLLLALYAISAHPEPWLVLLSFVAASILGLIPITPGGLGFVEAGLTGTLVLAGISTGAAVLATLVYRLVSFWLPIPIGLGAARMFRRRYPRATSARA